jgi:hypothetical protein
VIMALYKAITKNDIFFSCTFSRKKNHASESDALLLVEHTSMLQSEKLLLLLKFKSVKKIKDVTTRVY